MGSPAMQWLQIQIFKCANIQRLPSLKGKLWIPGDNRTGTPPGEDAYVDGGGDIDGDGDGDGDGGASGLWYQQTFWGLLSDWIWTEGSRWNCVSHTIGLYDMGYKHHKKMTNFKFNYFN